MKATGFENYQSRFVRMILLLAGLFPEEDLNANSTWITNKNTKL
jgi:hypothetical protein